MIAELSDEVAVVMFEATTEPIDVEAVSIEASVLLLTAAVPAVIALPNDDEADVTRLFVPVMREPIDVEAVPTDDVVFALIAV